MTALFVSKIVPLLIYPVGLTIILGLASLCLSALRLVRLSRATLAVGIAALWLASTPALANWLYSRLESEYPPVAIDALPRADVAIVLGGIVGQPLPPRLTPDVTDSFDRVLQTARIFKAGKVDAVLVSAGNLPWQTSIESEAQLIADFLVELGVPRDAIVLDTQSENTHENAIDSAAIMRAKSWRSALLVTSAAHMPRALATFQKAGVAASPAVTDIQVTYPIVQSALDFLPDADALSRSTNAVKEYIGLIAYRLAGWA